MKILSMVRSIHDEKTQQFCTNYTGVGMVTRNICDYIGRSHSSYLFVGKYRLPQMQIGNIHIVDTTAEIPIDGYIDENEKNLQIMTRIFEQTLDNLQPDIVNFHSIGDLTRRCMDVCLEKRIPFVYTSHLYIGQQRKIKRYDRTVQWESDLFKVPGLNIIAVSTGMRKLILKDFPEIKEENICVIKNGTDFKAELIESCIVKKYSLENKKVLLCVGTLSERKNQKQLVRAFSLLDKNLQEKIRIFFCGNDLMNGELQKAIDDAGLHDKLIYTGALDSNEIKKYYSIANGLVMSSLAEGLSIAALEAISYGLPVVMSADLECADDLNDEKVGCFAEERTDAGFAEAIAKWYSKKWDREYIIQYSRQFTMERVAADYIACYEHIIKKSKH